MKKAKNYYQVHLNKKPKKKIGLRNISIVSFVAVALQAYKTAESFDKTIQALGFFKRSIRKNRELFVFEVITEWGREWVAAYSAKSAAETYCSNLCQSLTEIEETAKIRQLTDEEAKKIDISFGDEFPEIPAQSLYKMTKELKYPELLGGDFYEC